MTSTEAINPPIGGITAGALSSPAIDQIAAALSNAQGQVKPLVRNKEGKVSGTTKAGKFFEYTYKYADLEAEIDAAMEAAAKNGLSTIQRLSKGNMLHVILLHSSGQWIDYGEWPLGNAEKHQERGSALTYQRRYAIGCVFNLAPQDDDGQEGNDSLGKRHDPPPWPPSVFETPELRTLFRDNAIKAFKDTTTLHGLEDLAATNKRKTEEMASSPNDHDRMVYQELRAAYAERLAELKPVTPAKPKTVEQALVGGKNEIQY